jgi:threonine dehydrogenase-like Zn-dependent dehydrogenase
MISRGAIQIEPLISAIAPLEDGPQWFDRLHNREPGLLKVVLEP